MQTTLKMFFETTDSVDKSHLTEKIHIVGLRNNWEIREGFIKSIAYILAVFLIAAIIMPIIMYVHYQNEIKNLKIGQQQSMKKERVAVLSNTSPQQKESSHSESQKENVIRLEVLLARQKQNFAEVQETNQTLQEQVETYEQQLSEQTQKLETQQQKLDDQNLQISEQKETLLKQKDEIDYLKLELAKIIREQEKPAENPPPTPPPVKSEVIADGFYLKNQGNQEIFGFKLRNLSDRLQKGSVRTVLFRQNQKVSQNPIPFDPAKSQQFTIRRFRSFDFKKPVNRRNPILHVRVIIWNAEGQPIFDQVFSKSE